MRLRSTGFVVAMFLALVAGSAVDAPFRPAVAAPDDAGDLEATLVRLVGSDAKASAAAADEFVAKGVAAVSTLTAFLASAPPVPARVVVLETLGRIAADHDEALAP
jgi:hypothetical protein